MRLFAAALILMGVAATAARTQGQTRFTGTWLWKVDGRNFLILRLEEREGKLLGEMVRPEKFGLSQELVVHSVTMPARVDSVSEVRREGNAVYLSAVNPNDPSKPTEWLLAPAVKDELHMKPAGARGMKSMRLDRVPRGTGIARNWDPEEVYEGGAVRELPGRYFRSRRAVKRPPSSLRLDPFYEQYVDAGGIPVLGSARVPAAALLVARDTVEAMLGRRDDIRRDLIRHGARVALIASEESITDLPEHRGWKKPARDDPRLTACERDEYDRRIGALSDRDYWNARARGIGGMLAAAGAENLLIHEFAHTMLTSIERVDPPL